MKLHKLFLIISLVLILSVKVFGQAAVDISLFVTEIDTTYIIHLKVGLDLTATNCIDPQLGEQELPPGPPTGLFDIRLDLAPYGCPALTMWKDYRNAPSFPYSGQVQHTLSWQRSSPGTAIYIQYDLPVGTIMTIQDNITGTLWTIGPFTGSGTAVIPGTGISGSLTSAHLIMQYNNIGGDPTPGPVFSMFPTLLNFGEVAFGESETLPVMITNTGYLDSLYIYNAESLDPSFTLEPNSFPIIVPPVQTQLFNITYSAIIGGVHSNSILFTHNATGSPTTLNVYATTFGPNPNCVAQVLSEIIVTDSAYLGLRILKFGLDSSATDGIDPQLGEHGPLPPFPPPGAFEAQLFLPENNFSGTLSAYCDFRYAELPYNGQKEWRLAYQTEFGNNITILWNFPGYITGTLLDIVTGTLINVPMTGNGSYTVAEPHIFNRLRMLIDFDIVTPVELTSFDANFIDNNVRLNWSTATETNNSGFEIQRKNSEWEKIGFVPGFGTTTEPKSYSFTDENVTTGIYKYRLKQIDFDGSFEYSNEIEVDVDFTPKEFVLYQNYPNPFNPTTTIKYEIPGQARNDNVLVTLKVYDVLGNEVATLVNEEKQSGIYEVQFNSHSDEGQNLSSGIYFYQLKAGDFISIKKMILMK